MQPVGWEARLAGTLNATRCLEAKLAGTTNAARCVTCSGLLVPGLNFLAQSGRPMNN